MVPGIPEAGPIGTFHESANQKILAASRVTMDVVVPGIPETGPISTFHDTPCRLHQQDRDSFRWLR